MDASGQQKKIRSGVELFNKRGALRDQSRQKETKSCDLQLVHPGFQGSKKT
jgi:hypothetical protein